MAVRSEFVLELPEENLVDYLFGEGLPYLNKPAYIDAATGRTYTFGKLKDGIYACAGALRQKGFKHKDVAIIYSSNNIDYPMAFLGVVKAGGVPNLCSPACSKAELVMHMRESEPVVMFAEMTNIDIAEEAAREYGHIRDIIIFDGERKNCVSFQTLLRDAPAAKLADIQEATAVNIDDVCLLISSSGNTGIPHLIEHSHRTLTAGITSLRHPSFSLFKKPDDVSLCALPLCYSTGVCIYMGVSIRTHTTVVVLQQVMLDSFLKAVVDYNVTTLFLAPPVVKLLATDPSVNNYKINSIQRAVCGGGFVSLKNMDKVKTRLHFNDFLQGYGLTEAFGIAITEPENMVEGTVGHPFPNNEIHIISLDTGNLCDYNVNGEIFIHGPQVMLGYHNKPELTAQKINPDGWLHTGDFGHLDENGRLFIVDRVNNIIRYNDHQVVPSELESLLLCHEAVQDVAVIGVPDPVAGELPRALVVLQSSVVQSAELVTQLEAYVNKRVPPQMQLRGGIGFRASLPRSNAGNIQRYILKAQCIQEQAKANKD